MRTVLLSAALLLLAAPIQAACPSRPDGAHSRYVENATERSLCLARELAATVNDAAARARIDVEIGNLEIELERRRATFSSSIATGWPDL